MLSLRPLSAGPLSSLPQAESGEAPGLSASLAAIEGGRDTLAASAALLVQVGAGLVEGGADTFAGSGSIAVPSPSGAVLAAVESAGDTIAAAAATTAMAQAAAAEGSADGALATAAAMVQAVAVVAEQGSDAASVQVASLLQASLAAVEAGGDVFAAVAALEQASGAQASLSATEAGADAMAASVVVIASASAAVTEGLGISPRHAALLESLARAHGLLAPLRVSPVERSDGVLTQRIEGTDVVTMTTVSAPSGAAGPGALTAEQAGWLEDLARVHGLIEPLVATAAARRAGPLEQSLEVDGDVVTVRRV